jgi:hypothetical protein
MGARELMQMYGGSNVGGLHGKVLPTQIIEAAPSRLSGSSSRMLKKSATLLLVETK